MSVSSPDKLSTSVYNVDSTTPSISENVSSKSIPNKNNIKKSKIPARTKESAVNAGFINNPNLKILNNKILVLKIILRVF